jgi:xylulokinase
VTLLIGIDLGTSGVKTVLFNPEAGEILAVAAQEYPVHKPAADRAEQDPEVWWQAAVNTVHQVTAQAGRRDITAISFSGQMHGTVLLNRHGIPLHPAIIWADQRSAEACRTLTNTVGPEAYVKIAGTLPATGFLGATLVWLAQPAPDLLARTSQVVLPKDYVRRRMTGQTATDISDAAGTGIFDVSHKHWADPILAKVDLSSDLLPEVIPSTAVAGELVKAAADALGLAAGLPVIAGCADQPAQAIGNGLIAPGKASVTTGSGGQVFTPIQPEKSGLRADPRLHVFNHAVPDMWYVMGAILSAGLSLRWLRNVTGLPPTAAAYAILSEEAAAVPPGADGLLFLPYLSGERTPHMDPLARGGFIGLSHFHRRGHLARAIMEGVAFALRQALEISLELGGRVELIIAAGGGAQSNIWRQIQADVFGRPLRQSVQSEQAGLGAALLAGVGVGVFSDLAEASAAVVQYGPVTEPSALSQRFYDERYKLFSQLYPRLREDFHRLARQT